ncbi:unnamed protein product [Lactuca virosa]|uniref:BZIP domain-containing protein n=1 Tax=Lactuca virosa TaxID=75947 RepID=A0AAU9P0N4_9ASTR|nr:unnamed protein product [Lactuca virosa]
MSSSELNPIESQLTNNTTTAEIHEIPSLPRSESNVSTNAGSEFREEQRILRMISNRELARRSRQRKMRHLEELREELNRLRLENQHLKNRLTWLVYQCRIQGHSKHI